jgi:Ca2+-binding RTX toxin-like protein
LNGTPGNDSLIGLGGSDVISGSQGDDTLNGGAGNDNLRGGSGNDRLIDRSGNNTLTGGNGDDSLRGGSGADVLAGGRGNNELAGGGDRDLFVLGQGQGRDRIRGFQPLLDQISLPGSGGAQSLTIRSQGSNTVLQSDNDVLAVLVNVSSNELTAANFA